MLGAQHEANPTFAQSRWNAFKRAVIVFYLVDDPKGYTWTMFTIEIEIDRPRHVVFSYVAHVENTPKWYSAVEQADKLTPSPVAIGARYQFLRRLPSGPAVNEVEVTEYIPNRILRLQAEPDQRRSPTDTFFRL